MGSHPQQFGPGSWYYLEEPPPPPPPHTVHVPVPAAYYPHQPGGSFESPGIYTALQPSTIPGLPIGTLATTFGASAPFENIGSGARQGAQETRTGDDSERKRYRIKRIRTACEECRKRKQRCDGDEYCGPCIEQGTHCRYRDIPPAKKDEMMQKMLDLAHQQNDRLETITQEIDSMGNTLKSIKERLSRQK